MRRVNSGGRFLMTYLSEVKDRVSLDKYACSGKPLERLSGQKAAVDNTGIKQVHDLEKDTDVLDEP